MSHSKSIITATLTLLLFTTLSTAADLLVDDFTDNLASHRLWETSNSYLTATVGGGSNVLANTSTQGVAEYVHEFDAPKPSTFTVTYVQKAITPQNARAGVFFCRSAGLNGYQLFRHDEDMIVVLKYVSGSGSNIFQARSFDLKPGDNEYKISKRGSDFNIFVNGAYLGSFTDSQYASGDLSFLIPPGATSTIGKITVTDQFEEGSERSSFTDNFDGNGLKYWDLSLKMGTVSVVEADGMMKMTTGAGSVSWAYVDLKADYFTVTAEAQYLSGAETEFYGIVLVGETPPGGGIVPMLSFGIRADSRYAVWTSSEDSLQIGRDNIIWGKLARDTIMVRKLQGSSEGFELLVNGKRLNHERSGVDFKVVGIGLFAYNNMQIGFDNFSAAREGVSTSIKDRPSVSRRPVAAGRSQNPVFYDIKGRKRYSTAAMPGRLPSRAGAAGVYVNENGRDVRVRKDMR